MASPESVSNGRKRKSVLPGSPSLVNHRDLAAKIGVTCGSLRDWVEKGSFPLPHAVIEHTMLFPAEQVEEWLRTGEWPEGTRWGKPKVVEDDQGDGIGGDSVPA